MLDGNVHSNLSNPLAEDPAERLAKKTWGIPANKNRYTKYERASSSGIMLIPLT
jgi:hypothetical protein